MPNPETSPWLEEKHLFQNYKQLQFADTLALYFNRTHPSQRGETSFEHVPLSAQEDTTVTIRPHRQGVYALSPYPFTAQDEFAYAGRRIRPGQHEATGGWMAVLREAPTEWETFRLVAG